MIGDLVSITIVTFNSARFIDRCLQSVFTQEYPALELILIDNASTDETPKLLSRYHDRAQIVFNAENVGFAAGQNQAIHLAKGKWILTLNPDVRLTSGFVRQMVTAGESDEKIGSVSGKLLAMGADFELPSEPLIDSTGIYFTPSLRHFDRGSKQLDRGSYARPEYVFGASGAAALYRRAMIADVSQEDGFFDPDFFAYREDADVAWRAQLLGWRCLYAPSAVAHHVRSVLPSNRRSVSALINMHSVKNRFLMRIKNVTRPLYLHHFLPITLRDLVVLAACLLREWSSLRAFPLLARLAPRAWQKRKQIMSRRRVSEDYIEGWFSGRAEDGQDPERIAADAEERRHFSSGRP